MGTYLTGCQTELLDLANGRVAIIYRDAGYRVEVRTLASHLADASFDLKPFGGCVSALGGKD